MHFWETIWTCLMVLVLVIPSHIPLPVLETLITPSQINLKALANLMMQIYGMAVPQKEEVMAVAAMNGRVQLQTMAKMRRLLREQ
ncbi:hypothetical protein DV515_00003839 [Chloebia gouldiae]|uniref:Uncharacterized protein n=1 Tax=Chloebia gouldiae TaxID=44316 RepID=A0A3L8SSH3_CHLGU|nr:hypothetical protein DV515_00003839 [Chloebia gouldiae]